MEKTISSLIAALMSLTAALGVAQSHPAHTPILGGAIGGYNGIGAPSLVHLSGNSVVPNNPVWTYGAPISPTGSSDWGGFNLTDVGAFSSNSISATGTPIGITSGGTGTKATTTINVLLYGVSTSSADNQIALQNAINDAQKLGLPLYIPSASSSCYKYTAPLNVTNNLTIMGDGSQENWNLNLDIPTGNPALTGSVLCPSSNGSDAIKIVGNSLIVNISDIGILFQTLFTGTGHGISYPHAESGGLAGSIWKNVKVYGHDGNHYGFYIGNPFYDTFIHLFSFGGGGFWVYGTSSTNLHYGNSVFIEPYADVNSRGSGYGYLLQASSSQNLNLLTFIRPQAIVDNISGLNGGIPPLSSQYIWYMDNNVATTKLVGADLELAPGIGAGDYFGAPGNMNDMDWTSLYTTAATTSMAAWGQNGIIYSPKTRTVTDYSSSGTAGNTANYAFNGLTVAATTSVTYPILATMYVSPSILGTNVSATKNLALYSTGNIESTGTYNTSGTTGGYYIDAFPTLQASSTLVSTAIGINALNKSFTGTGNTGVGQSALSALTSGANNSALGYQALFQNTTGSNNVALGTNALQVNTGGASNLAIGSFSLSSNTTGLNNIGVGINALQSNTTGGANTSVGSLSGQNERGVNNTFIGYGAGQGSGTPSDTGNVFLGAFSGNQNTGSYLNTCVGYFSCYNLTSGNGNVSIGDGANVISPTGSNQLNLANVLYGTNIYGAFSQSSSPTTNGTLGVSTSTTFSKFAVSLNSSDTLANAFTVSSSTASATTTLFSIANTGSTTASNGFNITAGCFAINGTCLASGVSSVSNSDGTLTISPTSGAVVASLALGKANSWTGLQQFQGQASSTLFSAYGPAYFGATATSSFSSTGALTLVSNGLTVGTNQLVAASGNVGVGTTTPVAKLSVHANNGDTNQMIFSVASSTASATTTPFGVANTGWLVTSGGIPNATSCGTTQSISGNQTSGDVMLTGAAVTTCTINFPNPVPAGTTLQCTVTDNSTVSTVSITATTTSSFTAGFPTGLNTATIWWQCTASRNANN